MLSSKSAFFAQILLKNQYRSWSFLSRSSNKVTVVFGFPQNAIAKKLRPQFRFHSDGGDPRNAFPFPKWVGSPVRCTLSMILYMFVLGFWPPWLLFYIMMHR